jgi:hypothetical protein
MIKGKGKSKEVTNNLKRDFLCLIFSKANAQAVLENGY